MSFVSILLWLPAHARIAALVSEPFSLEGFPKSINGKTLQQDSSEGWTYLEVAWRLRVIYASVYASALRVFDIETSFNKARQAFLDAGIDLKAAKHELEKKKNNEEVKKAEEKVKQMKEKVEQAQAGLTAHQRKHEEFGANYIRHFFTVMKATKDDHPLTQKLFPPLIREALILNQDAINSALQEALRTNPQASPFVANIMGNTDKSNELAVPLYTEKIKAKSGGSIGPVSLEVAFILGLQFAGLDLAAMVANRWKNQDSVADVNLPPKLYTCATFAEGDFEVIKTKNGDVGLGEVKNLGSVHTTIRTGGKESFDAASVGVTAGIDLEEDFGVKGKNNTAAKLNEECRYFSFSFHAVDPTTAVHSICHAPEVPASKNKDPPKKNKGLVKNEPGLADKEAEPSFYVYTSQDNISPEPGIAYAQIVSPGLRNADKLKGRLLSACMPKFEEKASEPVTVRPHCHQGFWETKNAFEQMFYPEYLCKFDTKAARTPRYKQVRSTHMYLIEEDPNVPLHRYRLRQASSPESK